MTRSSLLIAPDRAQLLHALSGHAGGVAPLGWEKKGAAPSRPPASLHHLTEQVPAAVESAPPTCPERVRDHGGAG